MQDEKGWDKKKLKGPKKKKKAFHVTVINCFYVMQILAAPHLSSFADEATMSWGFKKSEGGELRDYGW